MRPKVLRQASTIARTCAIVGDVADMRGDLAVIADARDSLGHRLRVLVDGKNLGAFAREQHRGGAAIAPAGADAPGAADQRHFSCNPSGHVVLPRQAD